MFLFQVYLVYSYGWELDADSLQPSSSKEVPMFTCQKIPMYVLVVVAAVCSLLAPFGAHSVLASTSSTYSGQATVVNATVLGMTPVLLSDTGPLPSSGGALETSLLEATVPGLLTAE